MPIRRRLAILVTESAWFDWGIYACIALNTLVMCLNFYGESEAYGNALASFNIFFTSVFCLEAALKLYGLGVGPYFKVRWNLFDFVVTVFSVLGVAQGGGGFTSGLRVLRIIRAVRKIRRAGGAWFACDLFTSQREEAPAPRATGASGCSSTRSSPRFLRSETWRGSSCCSSSYTRCSA